MCTPFCGKFCLVCILRSKVMIYLYVLMYMDLCVEKNKTSTTVKPVSKPNLEGPTFVFAIDRCLAYTG